jgi:chromodomain-helicase-DNA-binding protein 4
LKQRRTLNRQSKQRLLSVRSFSEEEWEADIAEGDDLSDLTDIDDDSSVASSSPPRISTRRSTLRGRQGRTDLPFSPRKTRPRKRALSESESSEMAVSDDMGPTRRSNRISNSRRINTVVHGYEDDELDTLSDEGVSPVRNSRPKSKPNVPKRGKASRAAYGHIRSIADLEYDELEYGPLSAHRHTCERCQRKPTHVLLNQQSKLAKRRKPKGDEDSDSEDKLAGLGGWVQWQVCTLISWSHANYPIIPA